MTKKEETQRWIYICHWCACGLNSITDDIRLVMDLMNIIQITLALTCSNWGNRSRKSSSEYWLIISVAFKRSLISQYWEPSSSSPWDGSQMGQRDNRLWNFFWLFRSQVGMDWANIGRPRAKGERRLDRELRWDQTRVRSLSLRLIRDT